jgi:predicted permease
MLSVIQYSFNAVMPIILLILMGVLARRTGYLDAATFQKMNKFNFRFNFFALMFVNLYTVESIRQMPVRMGIFMLTVLSVLLLNLIVVSAAHFSIPDSGSRYRRSSLTRSVRYHPPPYNWALPS